ncbi:hypothetical protein D9M68_879560 [compost metagenome]
MRIYEIVELNQDTEFVMLRLGVADQCTVRVTKSECPTAVIQPTEPAIDPYANTVTQRLSCRVILESDIREIKIMHKPVGV